MVTAMEMSTARYIIFDSIIACSVMRDIPLRGDTVKLILVTFSNG